MSISIDGRDSSHKKLKKHLSQSVDDYITNKRLESKSKKRSGGIHFQSRRDIFIQMYEDSVIKDTISTNDYINIYELDYDLPTDDIAIYHTSYVDYLLKAWINDCGIEIAPWHLYYVYLWQYSELVIQDPERYKNLLSCNDNTITVFDDKFDAEIIFEALSKKNPSYQKLIPSFKDAPFVYRESILGLVGHMSKQYYDTMIFGCSYPFIEVLGSQEDWDHLYEMAKQVYDLFEPCLPLNLKKHYAKSCQYFDEVRMNYTDMEFWKDILYVDKCGSGSQKQISGDILKILLPETHLVNELQCQISQVRYQFNESNKVNFSGLMYSKLINGILKPSYYAINGVSNVIIKDKNDVVESNMTKFYKWLLRLERSSCSNNLSLNSELINNFLHNSEKYVKIHNLDDAINEIISSMPVTMSSYDDDNNLYDDTNDNNDDYLTLESMNKLLLSDLETKIKFMEKKGIDVESIISQMEERNEKVKKYDGHICKFINEKTINRIKKIKEEGYFWHQDDFFLYKPKDENSYKLTFDKWLYYYSQLDELYHLIKDNPNVLTECKIHTDILWNYSLQHAYRADIYDLFVKILDINKINVIATIIDGCITSEIKKYLFMELFVIDPLYKEALINYLEDTIFERLVDIPKKYRPSFQNYDVDGGLIFTLDYFIFMCEWFLFVGDSALSVRSILDCSTKGSPLDYLDYLEYLFALNETEQKKLFDTISKRLDEFEGKYKLKSKTIIDNMNNNQKDIKMYISRQFGSLYNHFIDRYNLPRYLIPSTFYEEVNGYFEETYMSNDIDKNSYQTIIDKVISIMIDEDDDDDDDENNIDNNIDCNIDYNLNFNNYNDIDDDIDVDNDNNDDIDNIVSDSYGDVDNSANNIGDNSNVGTIDKNSYNDSDDNYDNNYDNEITF